MSSFASLPNHRAQTPRARWRRSVYYGCGCGCLGMAGGGLMIALAMIVLLHFLGEAVPTGALAITDPISDPVFKPEDWATGFASPYLGHTGSWDGAGGAMWGASKIPDLERERAMGLRWTFMPVYWRVLEPDGPVDLAEEVPEAWQRLDAFVVAAHERGLHILMQAPVVGGNAGGPPTWAGRRMPGRSAPQRMDALVDFAGRLADRYRPGGTLAQKLGWQDGYGVRAWELDNEPESYRTHWGGQAGDYAEFVTRAAQRIKAVDPTAWVVAPGMAAAGRHQAWLAEGLDGGALHGSPTYQATGQIYTMGPAINVVSFHCYEGLDTFFAGEAMPIEKAFQNVRSLFDQWADQPAPHGYPRKEEYWHTEGNFDFIGLMSESRRAAWRMQMFSRAFAAGIRKVAVMDAAPLEQVAVRAYIDVLPNPFPMRPALKDVKVLAGQVDSFRHIDDVHDPDSRHVWIVWAKAGTGNARVSIPVRHAQIELILVDGKRVEVVPERGAIEWDLVGDEKMAPPVLVVDGRPDDP